MNRLALAAILSLALVHFARAQLSDDPSILEPGRTQIEIDFIHTHDRDAGVRTRAFNVAPVLITHGLNTRTDIGLGFGGYSHTSASRNWGDLTLRAKYSLWGHHNSEPSPGNTAFALLPYVTIPLKSGDGSELLLGGLILPLSITLPSDWSLIIMTEFDVVADATDRHRKAQWIESLVLARTFSEAISAYIEFYSVLPFERGTDWQAQANFGFSYAFSPDFQMDAGCNFGLNRAAPDVQPFIGLTLRY